jgi:hypothetical protein
MTAFTFKISAIDISGVTFFFFAVTNIIFLTVLTVHAAEPNYATINRRDVVYHGHNLGAQICSFVTLIQMWSLQRSAKKPVLMIVHYIGFEIVKLLFAAKWLTFWPEPSSVDWVVDALARLNTSQNRATFAYFTQMYNITWEAASDPRIPPVCAEGPSRDAFLDYVRSRTYKMTHSVIELGAIASFLGLLLCWCVYIKVM